MNDSDFEWDDRKAASNFLKHRVSFEMARYVFDDPFVLDLDDFSSDPSEAGSIVIGAIEGRIFFVVFTLRDERIRIISARLAEAAERRKYHEQTQI